MKNLSIPAAITILLFGSCKSIKFVSYPDDVYVSPAEERAMAKQKREEMEKQVLLEKQKREEVAAAQKAKDDNNPYYKEPVYSADDYYDYQYASRIKRFSDPVYGASYYDPYYTNCYTYNQNPTMYGTSIYSTYNYWMPSAQCGYYSNPWATGLGAGYSNNTGFYYYDPYGSSYTNYYNSYGHYAGYNNYWNIGRWSYLNSYDPNSYRTIQYAARNSDVMVGSQREAGASGFMRGNALGKYAQEADISQSNTPRFSGTSFSEQKIRSRSTENNAPGGRMTKQNENIKPGDNYNNSSSLPGRGVSRSESQGSDNNPVVGTRITQQQSDNQNSQMHENNAARSSGNTGAGSSSGGGSASPRSSDGGGQRPR